MYLEHFRHQTQQHQTAVQDVCDIAERQTSKFSTRVPPRHDLFMCGTTSVVVNFERKLSGANGIFSTTRMRHVTHMNVSGHTYECVKAPIWIHVTLMNTSQCTLTESWHTCEFIMTRTYVRDVTHRHASQHTFEWVVAPFWMHHDTRMNALRHTLGCIMSQLWLRCSAFLSASWHTFVSVMTRINASWHTHECVVSHSWMRHGTIMNALWHTH